MMAAYNLLIGGEQRATDDHFQIFNPSTAEVVGMCPIATNANLDDAVEAARLAFPGWSATSDMHRKAACHALGNILADNAEELAVLLTREQGKPLNGMGSRFELGGAQAWTHYTADLDLPVEVIQDDAQGRIELHRKPIGVVASITPWNWPLMIAVWHIVPAIRTGNTVVIKPSPLTPLSTLRMVELMNAALPPGVLNAVAGLDDLGPRLTSHPGVDKIVFTGSSATGRKVMGSAAATLKRITLELGGNDAAIVLPDVDVRAIAEGLFWGAFVNGGQTCAALKRLYVHDDVYQDVCDALVEVASAVKVGDGLDEASLLGPVQNAAQHAKVVALVEAAKADGATILTGGMAPAGAGHFYPVTLVAEARDGMPLVDEEQFGPALPIIRFRDVDDVISRANASQNGLGGSIWSADIARARELASRLECGTAWINKHGAIRPDVPFGGVKASGIGAEFGRQGLEEYTTIQVVHQ